MSALGDIASALGPAAQGIGQGLLGGAERQNALQQQAFAQGQARTKMDLDKQDLALRQKALESQEVMHARQITSNMMEEVAKHRWDPLMRPYFAGPGKAMAAEMDAFLHTGRHALASGKAADVFQVLQNYPEAAMHHANEAGLNLPPGAQAQPMKPGNGTAGSGPGTPQSGPVSPVVTGGAPQPQTPDIQALIHSLYGPRQASAADLLGGAQQAPQSAQLPAGVAGPQPPAGAYRDATGTVMPSVADVGAGTPASVPAGSPSPVAAATGGSPAGGGTLADLANQAGLPGAAAPPLDALQQAVLSKLAPRAEEPDEARDARISQAIKDLNELSLPQREGLKAWLDYTGKSQDRQAANWRTVTEQVGQNLRTEKTEAGANRRAGLASDTQKEIAAGQRATQLVGDVLQYDAQKAQRDATYDQNWVQNVQRSITERTQTGRVAIRGKQTEVGQKWQAALASQQKVVNGVYQQASGGGGIRVSVIPEVGVNAGFNTMGGNRSTVTTTKFYVTPEWRAWQDSLSELHGMEANLPSFFPNSKKQALNTTQPPKPEEVQDMKRLCGPDGKSIGKLVGHIQQLGRGGDEEKALAIRAIHNYYSVFPNGKLPVAESSIGNPFGKTMGKEPADATQMSPLQEFTAGMQANPAGPTSSNWPGISPDSHTGPSFPQ